MRTFFDSTQSQESKSEVLSISDLSCSAFPELVIAELKLIMRRLVTGEDKLSIFQLLSTQLR